MLPHQTRPVILLALCFSFGTLGFGCSSNSGLTRDQARDQATAALCDYDARCGQAGADAGTSTSRSDCIAQNTSKFELLWPSATCDGKISTAAFDLCLNSIQTAECSSAIDFFATLDKCQSANVCSATGSP